MKSSLLCVVALLFFISFLNISTAPAQENNDSLLLNTVIHPPMNNITITTAASSIVPGIQWSIAEAGKENKKTMVLLHGYPQDKRIYYDLMNRFKNEYHTIAPDLPGWGETKLSDSFNLWSYEEHLNLLDKLIDTMCTKPFLVAHDYGAYLALGLVLKNPDKYAGVVFINSRLHHTFRFRFRFIFGAYAFMANHFSGLFHRLPHYKIHDKALRKDFKRDISKFDTSYAGQFRDRGFNENLRRFYAKFIVGSNKTLSNLSSVRIPVLILWGKLDRYSSSEIPLMFSKQVKQTAYVFIEDAGHFPVEEQPERVFLEIKKFLPSK